MSETIYKICPRSAWQDATRGGEYHGSADDLRDGFIHFSRASQVEGTARKYFAGQSQLVIIAVSTESLGAALRFEPSRGGELFPHLYAPLLTTLGACRAFDPDAPFVAEHSAAPEEVP